MSQSVTEDNFWLKSEPHWTPNTHADTIKWATTLENVQSDVCPMKTHPRSLIRVGCLPEETLQPWLPKMRQVKILIRLRECAGWSESSLIAHVRMYVFSHCGSDIVFRRCGSNNVSYGKLFIYKRENRFTVGRIFYCHLLLLPQILRHLNIVSYSS